METNSAQGCLVSLVTHRGHGDGSGSRLRTFVCIVLTGIGVDLSSSCLHVCRWCPFLQSHDALHIPRGHISPTYHDLRFDATRRCMSPHAWDIPYPAPQLQSSGGAGCVLGYTLLRVFTLCQLSESRHQPFAAHTSAQRG